MDELYHYGVLGMKWGVHRAAYKTFQNNRLEEKSDMKDKKAAKLRKRSEKAHSKYDLGRSNWNAKMASRYAKKAANIRIKSKHSSSDKQPKLNRKAYAFDYRSQKKQLNANRLSRTTAYGRKAMKLAVKSDKCKISAARARKKIASNKTYIDMMNKKVRTLSSDKRKEIKQYMLEKGLYIS